MKKIIKHTKGTPAMQLDAQAKNSNKKIYNLSAGDPNLPVPQAFIDGLAQVAADRIHQYCDTQGVYELRQVLDEPERVLISHGAKQLIYMSLMATCEPGDKVIIIGPCWSSYMEMCKILQLEPIQYIPNPDEYWSNDIFEIDDLCNIHNPSMIIFNNPNNPTGVVEGAYFIDGLMVVADKYNCWLLADEVYSEFVYEGNFKTLKNKFPNVIYINSFSKAYSLTGWRIGYCIAEPELIIALTNLQSQISGPPNTLIQYAILNALNSKCEETIDKEVMQARRDAIAACSPLLDKYKPKGGFYFYIPVEDENKTCQWLKDNNILVAPGSGYGVPNTIRISFANISLEEIKEISPYLSLLS